MTDLFVLNVSMGTSLFIICMKELILDIIFNWHHLPHHSGILCNFNLADSFFLTATWKLKIF
ncbi:hypothetical protein T10_3225 [Trichinella papuae]|uniref:Uncharacterized protein n=1 Tax=Trichinella papuae TaxID=268474 RepID=A0A0V1NAE9_9BILA|nr:hypothetical protein T10_3225 [Trichinella papuae]